MTDADVIVVGAGLAGLAAARRLRRAGVDALVLEAGREPGGRVRSVRAGREPSANLGGEWVGARHYRMRALAEEAGLRLEPTRFLGSRIRWRTANADVTRRTPPLGTSGFAGLARAMWRARRLAARLSAERPWEGRGAALLDAQAFGPWLRRQGVTGAAYELLDAFVGDLVSAPITDLSLLHVLWWVRRNGGPVVAARSAFDARLADGSQELARRLARAPGTRLRLSAAVTRVEQTEGAVAVGLEDGEELRARRAIVAVPATRLPDIEFAPALDRGNERLSRELRIGSATKVVATLARPSARLPRVVLGGSRLTACWRYGAQLTGFARPPHDRAGDRELTADLADAFAVGVQELEAPLVVRWAEERRIGGCDVCFSPGQLTRLGPLLRSAHGLVRFAGPERSSWPNNMEGALESGERAAEATLAAA